MWTWKKTPVNSFNAEVVVDGVAYSKADISNLQFNLIEPKIQKILEAVLKHNSGNFMNLLNVRDSDPLASQTTDFFEWMVMDSELLKQEYRQGKLDESSEQAANFCKSLLSYDMIASEIVRIASVFGLNEKFKDDN